MKKTFVFFLMPMLFCMAFSIGAYAQALLVEDFDYTVGTTLVSNGWNVTGTSVGNPIQVGDGLVFNGYAGSDIGGAALVVNNYQDVNKGFAPVTSGVIYVAFMFKTGSSNSQGYFLHLSEPDTNGACSTSKFSARVFVNGNGTAVGIAQNGTFPSGNTLAVTPGTTYLGVIEHDYATGYSKLYVFDQFPTAQPTSGFVTSATSTPNTAGFVCLRQYNNNQDITVDGIRVATTWAEAVTAANTNQAAPQCKLVVEIGRQYSDWNADFGTPWLEVYEDGEELPSYIYTYSPGTATTNTVIVPVTSGMPLRFVWHELDTLYYNTWCTICSPSGDIIFEKQRFEYLENGDVLNYTSYCDDAGNGGIVYVTPTGTGSGSSWEDALSSIKKATIIALNANADVWVASGTYYGDTTLTSENAFTMVDGVSVYGGFVGNEPADYNLSLRDFETNATILDGQNARRVLYQPSSFNTRTIWDGFTIQNGQIPGNGGGVYLRGYGVLAHCVIQNNTANYGGGVYAYYNARVSNCLIVNNTATYSGGGVYGYQATISNSTIVRNMANTATGIYGYLGNLNNSIVWGNGGDETKNISGSIQCSYSAVEGGCEGDSIVALSLFNVPKFVNPSSVSGVTDTISNADWHLQQGSVCVNRGNNVLVTDSVDLDGMARIKRDTVDLGCYESDYNKVPIIIPSYTNIVYVKQDGAGVQTGEDWANATSSLSHALTVANENHADVWVAAGTYYGNTSATNAFTMVEGVNVYGGFAGNEPANYDLSLRDFGTNTTILDGQNTRRVLYQPNSFSDTTVWDGFTIQNGQTTSYANGGGAYLANNGKLSHCVIKNNTAYSGGGVYAVGAEVSNCKIIHNSGTYGGGVEAAQNARVSNCEVTHNNAYYGGGIYAASDAIISNCLVANNTATNTGGGVYNYYAEIINSTIVRNLANSGSGFYSYYGDITNSIVWGNGEDVTKNVSSNVSWSYCAVEGGYSDNHNIVLLDVIQQTPKFVRPSLTSGASDTTANVDWHLQEGSVCINHGTNENVIDSLDLDGTARIKRDTVDLGCYESDYSSSPVIVPIVYVTQNGAGARTGSDWANAMSSIAEAQTMAQTIHGVVWVAAGTYFGDTTSTNAFAMCDRVNVYGSFAGNEPVDYDLSLRDFERNTTILDGRNERRVLYQSGSFNNTTEWDGFMIQNGRTSGYGGGANLSGWGKLSHCIVKNNTAYCAGGVYAYYNSEISNCLIVENTATHSGGGVYAYYGANITNATIVNNKANKGFGIYGSGGNLTNCIVWGNGENGTDNISGDISCSYSAIEGGFATGDHVIILASDNYGPADNKHYPCFVSPDNEDFHLYRKSSLINRGSNAVGIANTDLDNKIRVYNDTVDVGCYEFHGEDYCVSLASFKVQDVTTNAAMLTWQNPDADASAYCELSYKMAGDSTWQTLDSIMTDRYVLTGLQPQTVYEVRVRNVCDADNASPYSEVKRFQTRCSSGFETVTIGETTTTNYGGTIPTYMLYNYTYSQQIYRASEIGRGGHVDTLYFQYYNGVTSTRNVNIYLGHTQKTEFANSNDWVPLSDLTLVYSGNVAFNNAGPDYWFAIPLATAFEYNGSDNIVVAFDDNTGSYSSSGSSFYTHSVSGYYSSMYMYSNGVDYNPASLAGGNGSRCSYRNNIRFSGTCVEDSCARTVFAAVTNVTDNSAQIELAFENGISDFELEYKELESDIYTVLSPTGNTVLLTGLRQNTQYEIRVRTVCNAGYSDWNRKRFTTEVVNYDHIYVTETGTGDGGSWTTATNDFYWALNTARRIRETYGTMTDVWVATGIYYGDTTGQNAFVMLDGVNVYGGFAGNEPANYDLSYRSLEANTTILDGKQARRVLYQPSSFEKQTVWDGFTIQNGQTTGDGGGACLRNKGKLSRCIIKNNIATIGGGVYEDYNSEITNCLIANNTAEYGGGIFSGNAIISSSTIVRNTAYEGSGVYGTTSDAYLTNSIVWGNGEDEIKNISGYVSCFYSAVEGGSVGDQNILLSDHIQQTPKFVRPSLTSGAMDTTSNVDWHLHNGSVCINHGDNYSVYDSLDLNGAARIKRDTVDMGCYESDYYSSPVLNLNYTDIIYVTQNGAGTQTGEDWANATSSLSFASVLARTYNADIWVAAGTYYGDTAATSENAFTMVDGVNVYGGFAGNEPTNYDLSQRDFETNTTILDGQNMRRVLYQPSYFNTLTTWDGFTIQNGYAIESGYGGGAYLDGNGKLSHCVIRNNTADYGGGVCNYNAIVSNCLIANNSAYSYGGGTYISYGTMSNCLISNNTATSYGGGVYNYYATITNSTIVRNNAANGTGVYGDYQANLTNSIVWGNGTNELNNITGSVTCSYSAVEGGFAGEQNIMLSDYLQQIPKFVQPSLTSGASDNTSNVDWHLQQGSVCINRGSNAVVSDSLDLDGTARVKRDTVDMGCYESDFYSSPTVDLNYSNIIYVTQNGSGAQTGEDWNNATSSLSFALVAARTHNAEVWVAAGIYYGDTTSENAFIMVEGVNVYGGFVGNEPADYDLSLRDLEANETILDGQNARRVLYQQYSFNIQTAWHGFTIRNGRAPNSENGGGAYIRSKFILKNCIIQNNYARSGGGVYVNSGAVMNCLVRNNSCLYAGGGIMAYYGATISHCIINNNYGGTIGGVYAYSYSNTYRSLITNCLIANNSGCGYYASYGLCKNTTVVNNSSPNYAGVSGSNLELINGIVWGNQRNQSRTNIEGENLSISYSAIEGGYEGDSNIVLNDINQPLFVNPSATAGASDSTANVDWHLQQGSPCINRGDNSVVTDSLDLDGTARIKRDTVDLGCYESDYYSVPVPYCSTVYSEFSDVACDTYSWNDQTYTQSGNFIQSFELPNGCDSVVTLHLTVNHSVTTNEYLTVCASDLPYPYRDTMLDISTPQLLTITSQLLTQNGCDSTVILFLTVTPSTVGEFAAMTPTNNYPVSAYPIRFTWDAVENASNYDLYVWPVGEPQPQQPAVSRIRGTSYTLSSLANRSAYQWFMTAYNTCDTSLSTIRQFTLNVTPTLTVNTTNPVDLGEVQLNGARSIYFQVSGNALDSIISHKLTGADSAAFTLVPTNSWDSLHGGRMQLTFHPTIPQSEYIAQMTFQSDSLVRTITVKGYLSDYLTFTTYVDTNIYAMDSEIPIHGRVTNPLNEPVAGLQVEVYVKVLEYVRTFPVTSDANGQFTVMFTPQHSEAGYYTVGSRRAGGNSSAVHDEFNIPGMMLVSSDWIMWTTTIDQAQTGTIAIRNRSQIPITNIQVMPVTLPNGCTVQFVPLNLASMATGDLQYTVTGSQLSTGSNYEEVRLNAVSAEGAAMSFSAWYYCIPQRADLDVTPTSFTATMTRGQSKVVDFKIYNNGTGPTGDIYVSLPNVPWMSVVGSDTLPSLAVHDSAYVSIRLSPDSTIDLVRYTGNFAINCERGEGVSVPYSITAISDSTGTLVVDVTDEYTWNTNGGHGPHLAGASVTVRGYYSLETVATGVTDANGLFVVNDLPEGWYKLIVRADRHAEYQGTLLITAGDTNRQDIFIQFQAITYSWEVVSTEIEDEYTYELNVEFETHVPKPVVVLDMPENIPEQEEGDSYTFDYILTNYGLVTTYDVQLFTPESSIYTFTPLIDHMDSLPAQSTQIIPCVMSRPVQTRSASMNRLRGVNRSDCPYLIVTKVLTYYSCAGEQRPIWAYVSRNAGSVPCHTVPNNSGVVTNNTNNPPIYHGGSGSYSWTSGGNTYTIPAITMPVDLCECQDEITRDTTIIFDMDTVLFINGTDDYNFVAFCDSCDTIFIICTTINNCVTGEITYHCDTLSSDEFNNGGGNGNGSGSGGDNDDNGGEEDDPIGTCEPQVTLLWGSGDSYFNQLLINQDYEVKGVVADGTSIMKIQIRSECVFEQPVWILEYPGQSNSRYTGTILSERRTNDHLLEFVYKAPEDFPMDVNREYTVNFVVQVAAGDTIYTKIVPISIIRPPVLLVHGLNSDGSCFDKLYNQLKPLYYDEWQLKKVDYSERNTSAFLDNRFVLQENMTGAFGIVKNKGYVVSKADIVGHSMGGLLARSHVGYVPGGRDNVHKIITVNTPHSGAYVANMVMNRLLFKNISRLFMWNSDINAIRDLQVTSDAINELNSESVLNKMTGIPVHAIATTVNFNQNDMLTQNIAQRVFDYIGDERYFLHILNDGIKDTIKNALRNNHPTDYISCGITPRCYYAETFRRLSPDIAACFLDIIFNHLYKDYSDVVVPLHSQKGGLSGNHVTVVNGSFSETFHVGAQDNPQVLSKTIELLKAPMTSSKFDLGGFRPAPLNYPAEGEERFYAECLGTGANEQPSQMARFYDFSNDSDIVDSLNIGLSIHLTVDYNPTIRVLTANTVYSETMEDMAVLACLSDGNVFLRFQDTVYFEIPETYKGNIYVYALGETVTGEVVEDSVEVWVGQYGTTPQDIYFTNDTLYLFEGDTVTPMLKCGWANGDTTYITPIFQANDSVLYASNDIVVGQNAGTTLLTAHFEDLTASIPVVVYGWDLGGNNNGGDNDTDSLTHNTVCASVTVQFSQNMTMTREAFEGTLTINNGHESQAMQNIDIDFVIRDENGVNCTNLFQVNFLSYNNMSGTNGNASLAAQNEGSIVVQFIPTKQAAPEIAKVYSFGGSFSFIDPFTDEFMTYNLYPVDITVNPSPDLYVNYFMQRDIIGDDPLTEDRIEPIVPAELGVIIHNRGAGTAKNVLLETAEPKIIDNEKGLAVDFAMYGAAFNGNERQLGLMEIPFGNIEPDRTGVGEWWFTSTLLGHFVSYEAHVIHNNSFGNPDLSLVSSLDIHPLIHTVYAYGNLDDGINDFLVDDVEDIRNYPDSLYFSNGSRTGVAIADSIGFDHYVTPMDTIVILTLDPSRIGWNYEQTWDPGRGQYKLISCTRNSDQQVIPLSNVWQSFVTLPVGADPIYENKLHIVDTLSNDLPTTYTLVFSLGEQVLEVDTILNVPDSIITTPLAEVTVVFNKPIVDSTFNYLDMSLKCNNGENLLDEALEVERLDSMRYKLHLGDYTQQSGLFVLNVQTLNVTDMNGFKGYYAKQANWIQNIQACVPVSVSVTETICQGETYIFHSRPLTTAGSYTDTLQTVHGCDSIVHLTLTVNSGTYTETTVDTCATEYYWALADTTVNQSGTYYYYSTNASTCTDTTVLMLALYQLATTELSAQICAGEVYDQNGFNVSTAGDHYLNLQTVHGCDSTVILHLTVGSEAVSYLAASICEGDSYQENGFEIIAPAAGVHEYSDTIGRVGTCDSIVHLTLTVNRGTYTETTVDTCGTGYYWALADSTINQSGMYYHYSTNANTCTDTTVLMLALYQSATTELSAQICAGEVYDQNGFNASTAGDHYLNLQKAHGCDSIVHLTLTVNRGTYAETTVDTCGTEYYWALADTTVNQSGTYYYFSNNANTCIDTEVLMLALYQSAITELTAQICAGEVYDQNGFNASTAGDHYLNLLTEHGCDSTVILHLTVSSEAVTYLAASICEGDSYQENGFDIIAPSVGTHLYSDTIARLGTCDSVISLTLTVNAATSGDTTAVANSSFDWYGQHLTTSGDYTSTLTNAAGCDSVVTLHLTVNYSGTGDTTAIACDSFDWYEHTNLTQSGDYTHTFTNIAGGDSVVTLHLTLVESPALQTITGEQEICINQYATYHYDISDPNYQYRWLKDNELWGENVPVMTLHEMGEGVVLVTMQVTDGQSGCAADTSMSVQVANRIAPDTTEVRRKVNTNILICKPVYSDYGQVHYRWGYTDLSTFAEVVMPGDRNYCLYDIGIDTLTYRYWVETYLNEAVGAGCENRSYYAYGYITTSTPGYGGNIVDAYLLGGRIVLSVSAFSPEDVAIALYDMNGKLLFKKGYGVTELVSDVIPVSFAPGIYLLNVNVGGYMYSFKLLKM